MAKNDDANFIILPARTHFHHTISNPNNIPAPPLPNAPEQVFCKELLAAEKLTDLILKILQDEKQFRRYMVKEKDGTKARLFPVVDVSRIKALSDILACVEALRRRMIGVLTAEQAEKLSLQAQKMQIAQKLKENDDEINSNIEIVVSDEIRAWGN